MKSQGLIVDDCVSSEIGKEGQTSTLSTKYDNRTRMESDGVSFSN